MNEEKKAIQLIVSHECDGERVGGISVGDELLFFCLESNGNLLLSKDGKNFKDAKKMGLPNKVQIDIMDTIKLDMVEEEYLAPKN